MLTTCCNMYYWTNTNGMVYMHMYVGTISLPLDTLVTYNIASVYSELFLRPASPMCYKCINVI